MLGLSHLELTRTHDRRANTGALSVLENRKLGGYRDLEVEVGFAQFEADRRLEADFPKSLEPRSFQTRSEEEHA